MPRDSQRGQGLCFYYAPFLVRIPDLYKAGASFAGISDLRLLLSEDKIRAATELK